MLKPECEISGINQKILTICFTAQKVRYFFLLFCFVFSAKCQINFQPLTLSQSIIITGMPLLT